LGAFGIHKFYLGYKKAGIILLVINTAGLMITVFLLFIPNFIVCVIGVIEGILYLVKTDEEFEQIYVVDNREWF